MRLIDEDEVIYAIDRHTFDTVGGLCLDADITVILEELPTAQPEIIRCKDCKYQVKEWRDDNRLKDKGYWVYGCKVLSDICGYWTWFGQDDEYCSEAERRTDEID